MAHQNLQVPPCPRRASGHVWRLARKRSTNDCRADVCKACGLVRMTSYRTGQVVRYETSEDKATTTLRAEPPDHAIRDGERQPSGVHDLPSVALTTRFLALCREYGAERLAVRIVATGRSTGAPGLPQGNDWTAWDADEMRAAADYLERKRGGPG